MQAGYWVGGFHSTGVSTAANQQTQEYASGMLVFNTTTQEASQVDAPIAPVQNGALIYLPYGDRGVLLFLGGEKPASANGQHLDEEAVPVCTVFSCFDSTLSDMQYDWSNVYVYDIAADRWYKQPTTGATDLDRTQFCAVAVHDDLTETHQIWVMGGASYSSKEALVDV